MIEHTFVRTGVIAWLRQSPLGSYLDTLATSLHHEGYAPSSGWSKRRYTKFHREC